MLFIDGLQDEDTELPQGIVSLQKLLKRIGLFKRCLVSEKKISRDLTNFHEFIWHF